MPSYKDKIKDSQCLLPVFISKPHPKGKGATTIEIELREKNRFMSLIDTGAQKTAVSSNVSKALELRAYRTSYDGIGK